MKKLFIAMYHYTREYDGDKVFIKPAGVDYRTEREE